MSFVKVGQWAALCVIVAAVVFCAWWRLDGGTWERVETSSMGTTAPVGTLVWVESTHGAPVRAGEVVTFHPPDRGGMVFTHRVLAVHGDTTFSTGGDLSGPDQWRVPQGNVVGRARWVWPGAGWLVLAIPVLLIGAILTWGACLLLRTQRRSAITLGAATTLSTAVVVYNPLARADQLKAAASSHHVRATFVDTGLLPIHLTAPGSQPLDLIAGEAGSILAAPSSGGRLLVHVAPIVPPLIWLLVLLACFTPAVWTTLVGQARTDPHPTRAPAHRQSSRRERGRAQRGQHRHRRQRPVPAPEVEVALVVAAADRA